MPNQRPRRPSAPAQDQSELAAREIGRALRESREARGEELDEVADFLRIRPAYLASLEQGELRALPGRPYVVGFLRAYAAYLGLDGDVLVASLKGSPRPPRRPAGAELPRADRRGATRHRRHGDRLPRPRRLGVRRLLRHLPRRPRRRGAGGRGSRG